MISRRQRLANQISVFLRQYRRGTKNAGDPNDRKYSRVVEQVVRRMKPEELDSYLREDADDENPT